MTQHLEQAGYPRGGVDPDFKATTSKNREVRIEPPSSRFEMCRLKTKNERSP